MHKISGGEADMTGWCLCSPVTPASSMLCWLIKDFTGTMWPQLSAFLNYHPCAKRMQGCPCHICFDVWHGFPWQENFTTWSCSNLDPTLNPSPASPWFSLNSFNHIAWARLEDSLRSHTVLFSLVLLISYYIRNFPLQYRIPGLLAAFSEFH